MRFLIASLALLAASPALAQQYPQLQGEPVIDAANIIPDDQERALDQQIMRFQHDTGRQIMVATVPSLEGHAIEEYAVGLFRTVHLGRAGVNDGVLMLVAPNEHHVWITTGRGIEPYLTDAVAELIIQNAVLPRFKAGNFPSGISNGVAGIMRGIAPDAITRKQEQAKLDAIASQRRADLLDKFLTWLLGSAAVILGGAGTYWLATAKRRKLRREQEKRDAELARQAGEQQFQRQRDAAIAQARAEEQRLAEEARARAERIARETPEERTTRLAEEAAAAAAAAKREAALAAEREEERKRRERNRTSSYSGSSSSYDYSSSSSSSSSSYDSSSSSYDSSFSGGGGDTSGGGAGGSW